ncbi:MAG: hypothetical protein SGPRY_011613 [Prymnesium sp.]
MSAATLSREVSDTINEIKGKVIEMQVKCEREVAVTLTEMDDLYGDCVDLDNMLAKVFKYREILPGETFEQLAALKGWLSKMKLERFLAQFEERNCADLHILMKLGSDEMYEMLKQIGMQKEEAMLFMLNYTNLLFFDGDEHEFRAISSELPAWMKDAESKSSPVIRRTKRK